MTQWPRSRESMTYEKKKKHSSEQLLYCFVTMRTYIPRSSVRLSTSSDTAAPLPKQVSALVILQLKFHSVLQTIAANCQSDRPISWRTSINLYRNQSDPYRYNSRVPREWWLDRCLVLIDGKMFCGQLPFLAPLIHTWPVRVTAREDAKNPEVNTCKVFT